MKVGQRAEATTFLMANSISVRRKITDATFSTTEIKDTFTAYWEHYRDNALSGRDNILASICPEVRLNLIFLNTITRNNILYFILLTLKTF